MSPSEQGKQDAGADPSNAQEHAYAGDAEGTEETEERGFPIMACKGKGSKKGGKKKP